MNKNVVYAMLAVAAPFATAQAAVDVPVGTEAIVAAQDGNVYKASVSFGKLVPGTYTLSAFITGYTNGMSAKLGNTDWNLTNQFVNKQIIIQETIDDATLEISGPSAFTLGNYLLHLEWNLDKDAWNTLISGVQTKIDNTYSNYLSDANKTAFTEQLTEQQTAIEALTEDYDTYVAQELWNLSAGEDKISLAIKGIETNIETAVINDRWAEKLEAYKQALGELPTEEQLSALSTKIDKLSINKDKRQESYTTLDGKIATYKQEAETALGDKPTTVEVAIADNFDFNPTVTAVAITTEFNTLDGYVNTDQENATRYTTLTGRVTTATTNIGAVNTDNTKNLTKRDENAEEKDGITTALTTYSTDAAANYEATIAVDGEAFDYDDSFTELTAIENRITALDAKITSDNATYAETYNTIKGYITEGKQYYTTKMNALTVAIPEPELQNILEVAQGKLVAQNTALKSMESGYTNDYDNGKDLDADAVQTRVDEIKNAIDGIVEDANTQANEARIDLTAKDNALDAINAAVQQLANANTTINEYNTKDSYGTPSDYWTTEYNTIKASLENTLTGTVNEKYEAGEIATYYGDGNNSDFATALAEITGEDGTIAQYIANAKNAIDLYNGFYNYFYTYCQDQLNILDNRVQGKETGYTYNPIYDDENVLFTAETNYKAIIAKLQAIIDNAKQAAIDVTKLTGSAHLEELQRMCLNGNNKEYQNYYTGYSITVNGVTDSRGGTGGLYYTISLYIYGDKGTNKHEFYIGKLHTIYNETAFDNYKTTKKEEVEALAQAGDDAATRALITNVTTAIDVLTYDEEKSLDENKEAVDDLIPDDLQTQLDNARAEAAAANIVGYLNDQVASTQAALLEAVNASKTEVTGKMGKDEEDIQPKYTTLIAAIVAIGTTREEIESTAIAPDVDYDEETEENPNKYNSYVKKVGAYNDLIAELGKSTDDPNADGKLYAKYKALDKEAKTAKEAKEANDDAYTTLSGQLTTLTTSLDDYLQGTTYTGYAQWTKDQVAADVTAIQNKIDADQQNLDAANTDQKLTAESTIADKDEIETAISSLKTTAADKQGTWNTNESRYTTLAREFDANTYNSLQYNLNQGEVWINNNCADVAQSFATTIATIQDQINASKQALETAHKDVKLTASSNIDNKADIEEAIKTLRSDAQAKQAKYTANQNLNAKYSEVNLALIEQRAEVVAAAGDNNTEPGQVAIAFYRNKFNGTEGFVAQLATIKSQIDKLFDDPEVDATAYAQLETDLTNLQAEFEKVLAEAQANKAAYDDQIEAYNTAKDKYDEIYAAITDPNNYIQEYVQDEIVALEAYSYVENEGELKNALTTIETNYGAGEAAEKQQINIATLDGIVEGIERIKETLDDDGYAADIRTANKEVMETVQAEIDKIQPAYNAAVQVLNDYKSAKDTDLNATITAAASDLNTAVFGTVQQRNEFNATASQEMQQNNNAKTVWDASQLISEIQNYVTSLNTTKDQFLNSITYEIVEYWKGIKQARQTTIENAFNTLSTNGYIANETAEDVFTANYATIAEGDAIVYDKDENEQLTPKTVISITDLDDLVFGANNDGNLSETVFASAVEETATSFAKAFVKEKLDVYNDAKTGKKTTDWTDIENIFGEHPIDYGKPANTDKGSQEQFDDIVKETLTEAEGTIVTYETDFSTISDLLNSYDVRVAALKNTVQDWVNTQEAADQALATAQEALTSAKSALSEAVTAAQTAFDTLKGKVNQTSVANNYAGALAEIQQLITTAKDVAEATTPTTLEAVNEAGAGVAAQQAIITGTGNNSVTNKSTSVENGVIADLKNDLKTYIPDLQVQFNAYASSPSADQDKVTDWNARLQAAIEKTNAQYVATLDEMVALEDDIAKLRTELGNLSGDMTETIADFKSRLQTLQNAALAEADYGNKAEEFADALSAIKTAASALAGEVEQHETAGDIAPYVDKIKGGIAAQEAEWATLQANAAAQAEKVATNRATVDDLYNRIAVLEAAELTGEYSPAATTSLNSSLKAIQNAVAAIKADIEQNADEIQDFIGGANGYYTQLTAQEQAWTDLQEEAAQAASDWTEQKELSDGIYATLSTLMSQVETAISTAKTAISGYANAGAAADLVTAGNYEQNYNSLKDQIDAKKETFTLNNNNSSSYSQYLNSLLTYATNLKNSAAKKEAQYLYTDENSELLTAKAAAWDAYQGWTFARTVKSTVNETLMNIDEKVNDFIADINSNNSAYENMSTFASNASVIIAEYNGVVATIEEYDNYKFGDADQNGKLNVLDYQKMANMILNSTLQPAATDKLFQALDINQNEVIEVGDLTALVNYLLDANWQGFAFARAMNTDGEHLAMTTSQTQQGTQRIALTLDNVNSYTAFQLDVVLPEGMTIVGTQLGDRAAQSHRLMSRKQEDGSMRLLASSIKGDTFEGNNGAVLYIDVQTNADYMGGSAQLQNILFADVNAQTRSFTIGSETTGIDTMTTFEQLKQKVYDLGGRMKEGLKKGINIIRRADGKTEKVVK